jgi:hypothetical protein
MHVLIAMQRGEPHWMLSEADAKAYGTALKNALRHIPVTVAQKSIDYTTLFICAMNFEAPRIFASYRMRNEQRRPAQPARPAAQVYTLHPNANPPPPSGAAPNATTNGSGVEGFTGDGIDAPIGGH